MTMIMPSENSLFYSLTMNERNSYSVSTKTKPATFSVTSSNRS